MKRKIALGLAGIMVVFLISSVIGAAPVASARTRRNDKRRHHRDYGYRSPRPKKTIRIRFTDKDIDRLIVIGGIYFLSKAISEIGRRPRREVVYVSPSPPRYVHVPSPQPTYTPSVSTTVVTVRNVTNWHLSVNIKGMKLNLSPGCEQAVSWTYTGRGHYIEARAYLDPYHRKPVGTYQGNLIGYQIPWRLNFDYGSFALQKAR